MEFCLIRGRLFFVSLTLTILILVSGQTAEAQIKIYVNTDLEGISGVYKFAQTREKDTPLNIQACEYFMGDLAAVIDGLRDGGATEIVVLDGHGPQAIVPHLMPPGAKYITGKPRPGYLYALDSTFSGMVMLGFHAMKGTEDGVLNHTQSSMSESRYWYNDVESGEMAQNAAIAGYYGVPPIMVTGDEATVREARKFFGGQCITVAVKKGISREAAILYPFEETRRALYEGARQAVAAIPKCRPYKIKEPVKVRMESLETVPGSQEKKMVIRKGTAENALSILNFREE